MKRGAFAVLAALGMPVASLAGQDVPGPPPAGSRIRVTLPCRLTPAAAADAARSCSIAGTLLWRRADSLALGRGDRTESYGINDLQRLELRRGSRSHWLLGAGIGLVVGGGATYLALESGGSNSLCNQSRNQDALNNGECLGLTAAGAAAGAALGALIGSWLKSDRWEDVPLRGLTIRPAPPDGLGVRLGIGF